jgi:hypothetical protein
MLFFGRLGSDIREDLDPWGHSGPAHRVPQVRVMGEAARLLGAGEVMGDQQQRRISVLAR